MTTMLIDEHAPPRAGLVSLDGRTYPLESARVEARAEGGIALTTLRQRFRNPHEEALEVLYTLPLPADGAVLGYTIVMGERRIVGEIQTREAAAEAYREAIFEGRTAGLLEQDRSDTFRQQLGNLPTGTPVDVEIQVLHPLAFRSDQAEAEWEYRFPTTTGVRYMGAKGRVPDEERLSPPRTEEGTPARLSASVLVAGLPGRGSVRSPTHQAQAQSEEDGVRIRLVEEARLDRDLVLRWPALTPEVGVRLVEGEGLEGDDGRYALLTILPPERPRATHARDMTILLDSSGSMGGEPLALAKRVVEGVLGSLEPRDRFELLSFGTSVEPLTEGAVQASAEEIARARARLGRVTASGGTEMTGAVRRALRTVRPGVQHQVILVTDGYIGFEGEVVREAMQTLPDEVRFHAVGVGSAPNRTLTGGLARAGRGIELFAYDDASTRESADLLVAATAQPVLSELTVSGGAVREIAPARPGDVMAGRPTVLTVELGPGGGRLEVDGALAGEGERWRWSAQVPAVEEAPATGFDSGPAPSGSDPVPSGEPVFRFTTIPLGALHGREVVADLELEEAAGAPRQRVDREIEARALRHRIVSRRTSLVAMSETPTVDPRQPRRRERLAVELPAGVSAEGVGLVRDWGGTGYLHADPIEASRTLDAAEGLASRARSQDSALLAGDMDLREPYRRSEREEVRESRSRGTGRPSRKEPPAPDDALNIEITEVEVLRLEGDLLVLELETPRDGFLFPGDEIHVRCASGRSFRAHLDPGLSTPGGFRPPGVRIRIALRRDGGRAWQPGSQVEIAWTRESRYGTAGTVRWHLSVALPDPTSARPRT